MIGQFQYSVKIYAIIIYMIGSRSYIYSKIYPFRIGGGSGGASVGLMTPCLVAFLLGGIGATFDVGDADDGVDDVHDESGVFDEALCIDELLIEIVCDLESVSMALLLQHS